MKQRKKQPEATRRAILAAAGEVFSRWGYAGGALADMVAAAGLTKGALFHHFADKRSLALAWIEESLAAEMGASWVEALAGLGSLEELKRLCRERIGSMGEREVTRVVVALAAELGEQEGPLGGALTQLLDDWRTAVAELLKRGREAGWVFRTVKPASEAVLLVALLAGVAVTAGRNGAALKLQAAAALDDYLDTLRPQGS